MADGSLVVRLPFAYHEDIVVKRKDDRMRYREEVVNMRFCSVFPICLAVLSLSITAQALDHDFSDANQLKDWTIIGGDWDVKDGVLHGEQVPAVGGFDHGPGIVFGEDAWTDYVFEFKVKMEAGKLGGPIIRYIDEGNWYWFEAWKTEFYLRPHVDGEDQAKDPIPGAMWDRGEPFQDGEWHTYRIKAEGENITAWFNGEKVLDFTYSKLNWGRPAHLSRKGSRAERWVS